MKKSIRAILVLVGLIVLIVVGGIIYLKVFLPNVGAAPDITVEQSAERIEHGTYLANHVMVCIDCHSVRDWQYFSGPPTPGTEGSGGERFGRDFGLPGEIYSSNITPSAIGEWSDGEIFRTITTGVNKDGKSLFPIMPYPEYGKLDAEDIYDIIAYIRTLPAVAKEIPERELDFPVSLIINTIPQKASLSTKPNPSSGIDYGQYLVRASGCQDCHTRSEKGEFVGEYLAGGMEMTLPEGSVLRTSNITPHVTGIGLWNEEFFINRFKAYVDSTYEKEPVKPGDFMTIMPWIMYGGMQEQDLGAMFHYLKSIPPVENMVVRFTPAGQ